jgi:hypothetical protein
MHDRASLSHGTSPNIHPTQFDVEIPGLDSIVTGAGKANSRQQASDPGTAGALCFIALCQLTEILGDILPLIYNTKRGKYHDPRKSLLRSEASLEEWEENLPNWLDPKSLDFQRELPGVLSLQLSALAVKICICRVSLLVCYVQKQFITSVSLTKDRRRPSLTNATIRKCANSINLDVERQPELLLNLSHRFSNVT